MFKPAQAIFGTLAVLFLPAPLVAILRLPFTGGIFLNDPIPSFSTRWFEDLAQADAWRLPIVNSLIIGTGATALSVVLGTLAALGRRNGLILFRTFFPLPMVVPAVVLGVGLQISLGGLGLTSTHGGVILSHAVLCVPFGVIGVSTSLQGIDRRIERAAASLSASPATVFRRVTLPLALPGVVTGAVFAFATSLDAVVLTLFVAGPNQRTPARRLRADRRHAAAGGARRADEPAPATRRRLTHTARGRCCHT